MSMLSQDQVANAIGGDLVDAAGDKIGSIEDVYLDQDTNAPEWALVNTGLFGSKQTFVPLANASMSGGNSIQVSFDKATVKDAPRVDAEGELSEDEERTLYQYYGLDYGSSQSDTTLAEGTATQATTAPAPQPAMDRTTSTDDAVTRSEERVNVQKVRRPSELVRLRKSVVTERATETVPVQREEVRVEREAITDANRDVCMSGTGLKEDVVEIALQQEEVVVEKEVVPVERIRLEKDVTTEQRQVEADVRKEQIDIERVATGGTTSATTTSGDKVITDADNVEDPSRADRI